MPASMLGCRWQKLERIAQYKFDDDFPEKTVFLCTADTLDHLPPLIRPSDANFVLFLAVDATSISAEFIRSAAEALLDSGLVYLCVWGPDCERVHDIFDSVIVERNPDETEADVVMTTWHSAESLQDAIWFFLHYAWPAAAYERTCPEWIAAVINSPEWEGKVRAKLLTPVDDEDGEDTH